MFRQDGAGMKPWEPPWVANLTPDAIVPLRPGMLFSIEPCPLRNVRDPGAPPHPV
ncbi:MAG: aminopeptidase P family protein [Betaproteobacteria bacterium]|nr:aminopeptidase P family protein [Betaproteobacteria bacterium]